MKYLITESNLDKTVRKLLSSDKDLVPRDVVNKILNSYLQANPDVNIEDLVFEKLDNQKYKRIDKNNRIYFVAQNFDNFADIIFDYKEKFCYIYPIFAHDMVKFFDLGLADMLGIIAGWVESELDDEVERIIRVNNHWFFMVLD